jgi:hypothetical protein
MDTEGKPSTKKPKGPPRKKPIKKNIPKNIPAHRPPQFKTPKEMQYLVDEYFKSREGTPLKDKDDNYLLDKWGHPVIIGCKAPTIAGLALALGFNSRQSLLNYQAKPLFMDVVLRAKSRLQEYWEESLFDRDKTNGAKFALTQYVGDSIEKERMKLQKDRDEFDRMIALERIGLDKERLKQMTSADPEDEDDGFMEALKDTVSEVWDDDPEGV